MMSWQKVKIGDFLKRSKIPIDIEDTKTYKRVTIRNKHQGISLRDIEIGKKIGTKKQFNIRKGQFVLSKIDARYGAFGIAPESVDGAIITGNFWAYDVDENLMNISWLNQYTNSLIFYDLCERASSGITHRKYLDEDFFLNHELIIPDIKEQHAHVMLISGRRKSVGYLDNELTHQLDLLKKLRQQILQDAVQGKLVPQDPNDEPARKLLERIKAEKEKLIKEKKIKKEKSLPEIKPEEIPFEIPKSWVWSRLNDVCEQIVDCPHSTPKYLDFDTGFYGIDTNCINEDGKIITLRTLSKESYNERVRRLIPKENDIIYAREGSIGLAALIPKERNICLGQRVMLFRTSSVVNPYFLKYYITNDNYKNRLLKKYRGMGAKHINVKDIVKSTIGLPPKEEQDRIVAKIDSLMKLCDELEQTILQNRKYTQDLLQVALKEALEPKEALADTR